MNRLQPLRFGTALAATFAVLYVACALAVVAAPDATIAFFNNWVHGIDLTLLKPPGGRPLTMVRFLSGLLTVVVVGFAVGGIAAVCYNALDRGDTANASRGGTVRG